MQLKKFFSLCERNGILRAEQSSKGTSLKYGPLGSLLKRNILNEWLSSLLGNKEFQIFPIEVTNPREKHFLQNQAREEDTLPDVLYSELDCDKLFRPQPPFGYAVYGPCVNAALNKSVESNLKDFSFLSGLRGWTRLSLVFHCPPDRCMHWFYFWCKQRHIWWRRLSSSPGQFLLSGITSTDASQGLFVQLSCPVGGPPLPLEAVSVHEEGRVVTCHLELEAAVVAYLANSCDNKWRGGKDTEVLLLHSRLAPYQVCLWAEEDDKLQAVATYLARQLKGVSVFSAPSDFPFSKLDEMGIPYTVVLGKSTLVDSIVGLRNRDTNLQEQVHIVDLIKKLLQYLKI